MKNLVRNTFTILAIISVTLLFTQCKDAAVQKVIEISAAAENRTCPKMIDNFTRLDSCLALPNKTFKYSATILTVDVSSIDKSKTADELKKRLVYHLQSRPEMKEVKGLGVSFLYVYYDKNGTLIYEIKITPEDYNKPMVKPEEVDLSTDAKVDEYLETTSAQVKAELPSKVKSGVMMIDCTIPSKKVLEYTYTMDNSKAIKADTTAFKSVNKPQQVSTLKSMPVIVSLLQKGVTIKYVYKDANKSYICTTEISSEDL